MQKKGYRADCAVKRAINICSVVTLLAAALFLWSLKSGMTNKESIILSPQEVLCMFIALVLGVASLLVLLVNVIRAIVTVTRRVRK
jgi:hypothetical protein